MRLRPLSPPPVDVTGRKMRNKGRQAKSVLTVNGRVSLTRTNWSSLSDNDVSSAFVIDPYLDLAEQTFSLGVREMACRLNAHCASFDKTAELLERTAQVKASGESIRRCVESEGRKVIEAQKQGRLPIDWSATDCHVDPKDSRTSTRLYMGSDGVMVPTVTHEEKTKRRQNVKARRQRCGKKCRALPRMKSGADEKYKEFKLVTCYDETQTHRLVFGTKGNCEEAGRLMRRLAGAVHLDEANEKIANVDGAPWIRNQLEDQNLPLDAIGLDFYHLSEHVHKARRAIYGEDDDTGLSWAGDLLHQFKHDGYDKAWESLMTWRSQLKRHQRTYADSLMNYVSERKSMILYPKFQAKDWQIGSGPTEASCKTLTRRLKGSGMRWDTSNAEAIMTLEALSQSNLWNTYWENCYHSKA